MTRARWIVVVCVAVTCVGLILSGHGVAALVVLAAGIVIAIARRGEPAPHVRVERLVEVAELPHSCDVVWALIEPAENAPKIDAQIVRGYHVPGTPYGLGEQRALERVDGWILVTEVIEFEPGRRAMYRLVSPPVKEQTRMIQSVDPAKGGCVYRVAVEVDLASGQRLRRGLAAAWRTDAHEHIARIRQILATAHHNPTAGPGGAIDGPPLEAPPPPTQEA